MMMLLVGLGIGLVVGFLIGRFGKSMLSAMKDMLSKVPKAPAATSEDDGLADPVHEDDVQDPENQNEFLNTFFDVGQTAGIDDNPEVVVNPIFDYQIRKQKELDRLEFARKKAEEEGLTLDEMGDDATADVDRRKNNALATLIIAGARVTSVQSGHSAAAQAASDTRRKMKNIETYLSKYMDINVSTAKRESGRRNKSKSLISAYEKAMQTRDNPTGDKVTKVAISAAKRSRGQLKAILRQRPELGTGKTAGERRNGVSTTEMAAVAEELAEEFVQLGIDAPTTETGDLEGEGEGEGDDLGEEDSDDPDEDAFNDELAA